MLFHYILCIKSIILLYHGLLNGFPLHFKIEDEKGLLLDVEETKTFKTYSTQVTVL